MTKTLPEILGEVAYCEQKLEEIAVIRTTNTVLARENIAISEENIALRKLLKDNNIPLPPECAPNV